MFRYCAFIVIVYGGQALIRTVPAAWIDVVFVATIAGVVGWAVQAG